LISSIVVVVSDVDDLGLIFFYKILFMTIAGLTPRLHFDKCL